MIEKIVSLSAILLLGCSEPPQPSAQAAPASHPSLSIKQLMEWVIDPAADVVWESVKTIITEQGTKEIAPRTDEQWDAVRHGAAILAESGNLLLMEGRASDGAEWTKAAHGLTNAAEEALNAIAARNSEALFASGGHIYDACSGCHRQFAPQLNADPVAR